MTKEIFYLAIGAFGILIIFLGALALIGWIGPKAEPGLEFIAGLPMLEEKQKLQMAELNTNIEISKTMAIAQADAIKDEARAKLVKAQTERDVAASTADFNMKKMVFDAQLALEKLKADSLNWNTFWSAIGGALIALFSALGISFCAQQWRIHEHNKMQLQAPHQSFQLALSHAAQTGGSVAFKSTGEIEVKLLTAPNVLAQDLVAIPIKSEVQT